MALLTSQLQMRLPFERSKAWVLVSMLGPVNVKKVQRPAFSVVFKRWAPSSKHKTGLWKLNPEIEKLYKQPATHMVSIRSAHKAATSLPSVLNEILIPKQVIISTRNI